MPLSRLLPLLALALLAGVGNAQEVTLPQTVSVAVGRLAAVEMSYQGDDFAYVVPPELDAFREYTTDPKSVKLRVMGFSPGTYIITAVATKAVDGKGKLSPFKTCLVVVGGGPAPVPVPVPTPGKITVPSVIGLKWDAAKELLKGLVLLNPDGPIDQPIVSQTPEAGTLATEGSFVYVKTGPPPNPTPGPRQVLILRESRLSTPAMAAMIRNLRDTRNLPAKYIQDKKHSLFILDVDSLDENGKPSSIVESYKPLIVGKTLPVLVVLSQPPVAAAGFAPRGPPAVVGVKEFHMKNPEIPNDPLPDTTAEQIIEILKGFGG